LMFGSNALTASVIEGVNGNFSVEGMLLGAEIKPLRNNDPTGICCAPDNEMDLVAVKAGPALAPVIAWNTLVPSRTEAIENPPRMTVWPDSPIILCRKPFDQLGLYVKPKLGSRLKLSFANTSWPFALVKVGAVPERVPGLKMLPTPETPK